MTDSLREQMLKMGLVTPAQAQAADQKPRGGGRKKGRGKRAPAPSASQSPGPSTEGLSVPELVKRGRVTEGMGGRRRFYFETRTGDLPFVEVNDALMQRLTSGEAAICESPGGRITVVDGQTASAIFERDCDWLRTGPAVAR